jgi:hypothetical protein
MDGKMASILKRVDFYRSVNFKDLQNLVEFNDGLPKELTQLPWRVPKAHPQAQVINQLLGEAHE